MSKIPPNIEVRYDMDDVTRDGTMPPFRRSFHREFKPGLARYFVDGKEVSKEEADRIAEQWRLVTEAEPPDPSHPSRPPSTY